MKTIHKTVLPDGRQGITIFSDPDIISEMVKLCKERNIHVNESPIIDEQFIQNLTKSVNDDLAIQKIERMAEKLNITEKNKSPENLGFQDKLKQLAKKEK